MEQHMNYNYIDSSRNNLIEKEEYEFYLEEIGIDVATPGVQTMISSLTSIESPIEVS
jgi:hypothetical protein